MELAEKAGSGLIRMRKAMRAYKLSVPRIKAADKHWFSIYFVRPEMERIIEHKPLPARLVVEGVNKGVNEGVNVLTDYIVRNPGKRTPQIAQALAIPPKTIERWLKKLKSEGKIKYEGSSKTGGYYKK